MTETPQHLIIAPILIPLLAGALMLFYEDRDRQTKFIISLGACAAMLVVAIELLLRSKGEGPSGGNQIGLYLLGDWPTPFGINLVLDRLAALMLVIASMLSLPALVYAYAGWQARGQHFHSLFMFQMMGVNGAFLTGDLFNLFVFFEIMLAASYGLLLHGSGPDRVRSGMHYIVINLVASLFFLIGVSLIYGITGTLNMAELARQMPYMEAEDRPLVHAAMAILGLVFLVKAGIWPLGMWLPAAYQSASAPAAAIFAILTKVGVYVILRLGFLAAGPAGGPSSGFGAEVLVAGGIATMIYGSFGILGSPAIGRMAGYAVLVSSGSVLGAVGLVLQGGGVTMLSGALYYMTASTLGLSALFLLVELVNRGQGSAAAMLALSADLYGAPEDAPEEEQKGIAVPATMTVLGLCFAALAVLLAGLPPFAGFLGKVIILSGLLQGGQGGTTASWIFMAILIVSGLATLIALMRLGVQTFWSSGEEEGPKVLAIELAPIVALLLAVVVLTWQARPVMRYMEATASALHRPDVYINGVISAERTSDREQEAAE
ncbi:monovalent cation/H+ antiporter subunit D [Falsirhodobacter deserti]|uniref:monovalent cation/H+ antiporter subunit D n=1 Tax=Falsirhodobacter deserti TaxID=1365611 RepID=UPI000FE3C0D8|nr:monovalent cation/H+ antiporter subunit D [Falsirhodobacter deserti]